MNKNLIIIGAGSVGGFLASNLELFGINYNVIGFLDDDKNKIGKDFCGFKVLGAIQTIGELNDEELYVAIGIAFPKQKKNIIEKLKKYNNIHYPSFISKNAWLSNNVKVGKGVIIYPNTSINYNSIIDDFAVINMNCAIGHDCHIAKFTSLAPHVSLGGYSRINEAVEMGINSSTIQNITIGEGATIGGQSIITKDVLANSIVVGVPGRKIKAQKS